MVRNFMTTIVHQLQCNYKSPPNMVAAPIWKFRGNEKFQILRMTISILPTYLGRAFVVQPLVVRAASPGQPWRPKVVEKVLTRRTDVLLASLSSVSFRLLNIFNMAAGKPQLLLGNFISIMIGWSRWRNEEKRFFPR